MRKIEIRRITKDMDGQFIIEASNAYGSVQDYFILRVLDSNYLFSFSIDRIFLAA